MRPKISMALIIILAIFLGGCAAPKKEVVSPRPVPKETIPVKPTRIDDLDSKLTDLTNQIIFSLSETKRTRIAIIEFSDLEGNITEFGKYLSEELIARLFRTGKFKVIERHFLNKVIEEHKLSYTHFFDEKSVRDIGRFLGVDAIASGSVTDLGNSVKVNARLIATETGSIFSVASVEILKDEKVARLLAKKAKSPYQERKMVAKAPETPSPTQIPSPPPEKPKPEEPLPEKPSVELPKVEANNFIFELKECKMSGTNITCKLLITNNDQDRKLRIDGGGSFGTGGRSRIFDDSGNEYVAGSARLGRKTGSSAMTELVSGVTTKGSVSFERVSPQAKMLAVLELRCADGGRFKVQFRNVPLSK